MLRDPHLMFLKDDLRWKCPSRQPCFMALLKKLGLHRHSPGVAPG